MSDLDDRLQAIEQRVAAIEFRNKRVEQDKKWETSIARRLAIALLTYVCVLVFLLAIEADNAPLGALVPLVGFTLSTLALRPLRKLFERKHPLAS